MAGRPEGLPLFSESKDGVPAQGCVRKENEGMEFCVSSPDLNTGRKELDAGHPRSNGPLS